MFIEVQVREVYHVLPQPGRPASREAKKRVDLRFHVEAHDLAAGMDVAKSTFLERHGIAYDVIAINVTTPGIEPYQSAEGILTMTVENKVAHEERHRAVARALAPITPGHPESKVARLTGPTAPAPVRPPRRVATR